MRYECYNCHAKYKTRGSLFRWLSEIGEYNDFCHKCFRKAFIENYGHLKFTNEITGKSYCVCGMPVKMLRDVMYMFESRRTHEIMNNPEKLEKAQQNLLNKFPELKKMVDKIQEERKEK